MWRRQQRRSATHRPQRPTERVPGQCARPARSRQPRTLVPERGAYTAVNGRSRRSSTCAASSYSSSSRSSGTAPNSAQVGRISSSEELQALYDRDLPDAAPTDVRVVGWDADDAISTGRVSRLSSQATEVSYCPSVQSSRRSICPWDYASQPASSSAWRPKSHNRKVLILWFGKHSRIFTTLSLV